MAEHGFLRYRSGRRGRASADRWQPSCGWRPPGRQARLRRGLRRGAAGGAQRLPGVAVRRPEGVRRDGEQAGGPRPARLHPVPQQQGRADHPGRIQDAPGRASGDQRPAAPGAGHRADSRRAARPTAGTGYSWHGLPVCRRTRAPLPGSTSSNGSASTAERAPAVRQALRRRTVLVSGYPPGCCSRAGPVRQTAGASRSGSAVGRSWRS